MKFKVKVVAGVEFPGVGISRKNKETSIEATSLPDAMTKAAAFAAQAFPGDPAAYKAFQVSVTIDDGKGAPAAE